MEELPLYISPQAWEKIQFIRHQKSIGEAYSLRLGMRGSGCSGQFFLGFDVAKPEDMLFTLPEGNIIINKAQLLYFYTISLEWIETENEKGLKFIQK
jgi:iron-sulfur cluster assembly protein